MDEFLYCLIWRQVGQFQVGAIVLHLAADLKQARTKGKDFIDLAMELPAVG